MIVHVTPHHIAARHGFPSCYPRWTAVQAPQLRLDFLTSDGEQIGHAIVLDMSGLAFILYVQVLPALRSRGHGRAIHLELIRRYGAVACETFCSEDETACIRSLVVSGATRLTKEPGPLVAGWPAISRHCVGVREMYVLRLHSPPDPAPGRFA